MSKIVYCHNRNEEFLYDEGLDISLGVAVNPKGGSTVAMEPIQSWLLDTVAQGDSIQRKIGIARCSEDDNYCKKTGRELAKSRMKTKTLVVVNVIKNTDQPTVVFFEDEDDNLFELKVSKDPYCAILVRMLDDN